MVVGMMCVVSFAVIFRYITGHALAGVVTISELLLVWITFLGAAWVLKIDGHVKVDIVYERLNPRVQAIVHIIVLIVVTASILMLLLPSIRVTWRAFLSGAFQLREILIPDFAYFAAIALGSLLLMIECMRQLRNSVRMVRGAAQLKTNDG